MGCDAQTGIKRKKCIWLSERKIGNCFAGQHGSNENESNQSCLERLDEEEDLYNKIDLNRDYSSLEGAFGVEGGGWGKNIQSKLEYIQTVRKKQSDENETINADLAVKQKFTYSALLKLLILACFIILFISTIMINNDTLYDITFTIIMIILIYNLYIFMKPFIYIYLSSP